MHYSSFDPRLASWTSLFSCCWESGLIAFEYCICIRARKVLPVLFSLPQNFWSRSSCTPNFSMRQKWKHYHVYLKNDLFFASLVRGERIKLVISTKINILLWAEHTGVWYKWTFVQIESLRDLRVQNMNCWFLAIKIQRHFETKCALRDILQTNVPQGGPGTGPFMGALFIPRVLWSFYWKTVITFNFPTVKKEVPSWRVLCESPGGKKRPTRVRHSSTAMWL